MEDLSELREYLSKLWAQSREYKKEWDAERLYLIRSWPSKINEGERKKL